MIKKTLLILGLLFSTQANADNNEIQCLANAIHYEARSEGHTGKVAVGNVVMNRTKSGRFPKGVCRVVSQRNQFSWYPASNTRNEQTLKIARDIYQGNLQDRTSGSLFFHSTSIKKPRGWNARYIMTIGRHRFYK